MKIVGKILKIDDIVIVNPKFKKCFVLVLTEEKHPQKITVEFQNKKADLFKWKFFEGATIELELQIRGQERPNGKIVNYIVGKDVRFKNKEQISFINKLKQLLYLGYEIKMKKSNNLGRYNITLDNASGTVSDAELTDEGLAEALKNLETLSDLQS